MTAHN